MNIFDLSYREVKDNMKAMIKTSYGLTTLTLAFAPAFMMLILIIGFVPLIYMGEIYKDIYIIALPIALLIWFIIFINGCRFYYKKLELYIESKGVKHGKQK